MSWIELSSKAFRRHHSALVDTLSEEQKYLLEALKDDCTANLYLAGIAGTGKSTVMRAAAEECCINFGMSAVAILAPTHVAAKNVGGQTIASFLGAKPGTYSENATFYTGRLLSARKSSMQQELRFLFVDEVGMITADELDRLNEFMCEVMRDTLNQGKTGSFGGLKTLLAGDPLQVPPVQLSQEGQGFFFQSNVFCAEESQFLVLYLKQGFRTDNAKFLDLQAHCRIGCAQPDHIEYANKNFGSSVGSVWQQLIFSQLRELYTQRGEGAMLDYRIRRYFISGERIAATVCVRQSVEDPEASCSRSPFVITLEKEERNFLGEKYEESFGHLLTMFVARDEYSYTGRAQRGKCQFLLPEKVHLAVEMRVTVLWDKAVPSICKGTNGIITALTRESATVQIESAGPHKATVIIGRVTERVTDADGQILGSREQMPLSACIAGTHYFVQGQTLEKVPCIYANERVCKEQYGASYTVISRFRYPEYILPLHPLKASDFTAAEAALRFDQYHAQQDHPITAVNYHYRGAKGVRVKEPPCQCKENGQTEGCTLCWDIGVVKARAVLWLDKIVHNFPKSTGRAVVSPPPSISKKGHGGSRLFVEPSEQGPEVYKVGAVGGTEEGAFPNLQKMSVSADNERNLWGTFMESQRSAVGDSESFEHDLGFGEDTWGGEGAGEILPMDLYWDSIDQNIEWEYGNNSSRAISVPGTECDLYVECGTARCSNYQSNLGIKVWDNAQTLASNHAARNGANRIKGPPKDTSWLPNENVGSSDRARKLASTRNACFDADVSGWQRKKPRLSYPDLGELNRIGTISIPAEPQSSGATWDGSTALWLHYSYNSISDTRGKRDKRSRQRARDMLAERGVEMAQNALSAYEYLYYAFCAKFPNERRSLQDIKDCINGNKQNKNFKAKLVALSKPRPVGHSSDSGEVLVYRELLISSDNNVYEFAALPSDKEHCLWSRVVLRSKS